MYKKKPAFFYKRQAKNNKVTGLWILIKMQYKKH